MKLLANLHNALPAATGQGLQALLQEPRVAALAVRLLKEGLLVARAERVRLEPIPWASPRLAGLLAALPDRAAGALLARRVRRLFGERPVWGSTLQSLRRGRATEIDFLNGEVAARAPAWPRGARERGPGGGGARGREGAGFLEPEELLRRCA